MFMNQGRLAIVLSALAIGIPAQKPIVKSPVIADYIVPQTLEGLLDGSDAVAVLRVISARDVSQGVRQRTSYEMQLVQTLKEDRRLGATSHVCRAIGIREYPDRLVEIYTPGFPAFSVGSDYLLFLTWNEADACFWPTFGQYAAASIAASGRVRPFVNHAGMKNLNGVDRSELPARVAAARKK